MASSHYHHPQRPVSEVASWSLLRLSAWQRLGFAGLLAAAVWAATLAVML